MKKSLYETVGGLLVRTPLMPVNSLAENSDMKEVARTALAVGSPSLYQRMLAIGDSKGIEQPLHKYKRRMASRPTPYGLFAGVSWAEFDKKTNLVRDPEGIQTHTRPDMSWFLPMLIGLERDKHSRMNLKFFPNPCIQIRGDRLLLDRAINTVGQTQKTVNIQALDSVRRALDLCRVGINLNELSKRLSREFSVTKERALALCHNLCDLGFLISNLRFSPSDWKGIETILRSFPVSDSSSSQNVATLQSSFTAISDWDTSQLSTDKFFQALAAVEPLSQDKKNLLQVDATFEMKGESTVSELLKGEVASAVEILLSLSTQVRYSPHLSQYKNRFLQKYQNEREVPILELFSPVAGLGTPYRDYGGSTVAPSSTARNTKLLELYLRSEREKVSSIRLSEQDLVDLRAWTPNESEAPLSLDLYFSIISDSIDKIDNGDFEILVAPRIGDSGAGRSIGRFINQLSCDALEGLSAIAEAEHKASGNLLADISYWPSNSRITNVVISPGVRSHSIAVNCAPAQGNTPIELSDILVGVADNRFYVRWAKTGQKITARSNNMLNFGAVPDLARFLLEIEEYGRPRLSGFDWDFLSKADFLPRLTYGKTILSRATWNLSKLSKKVSKDESFEARFEKYRNELSVPRFVHFVSYLGDDNTMFLDLESSTDQNMLEELIGKRENWNAKLIEHISTEGWSQNSSEKFVSEFVASVVRTSPSNESKKDDTTKPKVVSGESFLKVPGCEWLYLCLDCHQEVHEDVLLGLRPMVQDLKRRNVIEEWFFVRYIESGQHQLRLRFKCEPTRLFSVAYPELLKWASSLSQLGLSQSFSVNTYNREVERYGGTDLSMALAESIFTESSELALGVFEVCKSQNGLNRNLLALLTVHSLLQAFEKGCHEACECLSSANDFVQRETISKLYRESKDDIYKLLLRDVSKSEYAQFFELIDVHMQKISPFAQELLRLEKQSELSTSSSDLCQSFIHLQLVRIFGIDPTSEHLVRALLYRGLKAFDKRRAG